MTSHFTFAVLALALCLVTQALASLPDMCTLPEDGGELCDTKTSSTRYRYKMTSGKCVPFQYKGCGGNSNNFDTMLECDVTCKDALVPKICQHDIKSGRYCLIHKPSTRYGFDIDQRRCISFEYKGCGGNINNFDTLVECRKTCETD